jgi:hypothetical protein
MNLVHAILGVHPPAAKQTALGLPGSHGPGTPCWSLRVKISLVVETLNRPAAMKIGAEVAKWQKVLKGALLHLPLQSGDRRFRVFREGFRC